MCSRLPLGIMTELKEKYGLDAFLETGTHIGETAAVAATHFPDVFTVELSIDMLTTAKKNLSRYQNITYKLGTSPEFIRETLSQHPDKKFLFWLDGHWCGGPKLGPECPLLLELAEIAPSHRSHAILIDDARLFLNPPPPPHDPSHWPTFEVISDMLKSWSPSPKVRVEYDVIIVEPS